MAAGDTTNPDRTRFESNERVDLVDLDRVTQQDRLFIDAATRALLFTPRATAGGAVGLVLAGGSLVANPTGPSDGKVRLPSDLFVALDADNRFLVNSGSTVDVSVPSGGAAYQIYAYFAETPTTPAKRRKVPVSAPFTEFTALPNVLAHPIVGLYVRSGSLGSSVPTDTVNGITTNLCLLGIVSNTAGVVTVSFSTANRLSTVVAPLSSPTASTNSGSIRTVHDLSTANAYGLARTKFKEPGSLSGSSASIVAGAISPQRRISGLSGMTSGAVGGLLKLSGAASSGNNGFWRITNFVSSTSVDVHNALGVVGDANNGSIVWSTVDHVLPEVGASPQASNNYGAYVEPRRALDEVDRATFVVTIGDGVSTFGTLDRTQFANDSELLQAAFNTIASRGGGRLVLNLKSGIALSLVSDVVVPTGIGSLEVTSPGLTVISCGAQKFTFDSTTVRITNLSFSSTTTAFVFGVSSVFFQNCFFVHTTSSSVPMILSSANPCTDLTFLDCRFVVSVSGANNSVANALMTLGARITGTYVSIARCTFSHSGAGRRFVAVEAADHPAFVFVDSCSFKTTGTAIGDQGAFLLVASSVGSAVVTNCNFTGGSSGGTSNMIGIAFDHSSDCHVSNCAFSYLAFGIYTLSPDAPIERISVQGCTFSNSGSTTALTAEGVVVNAEAISGFAVSNCSFFDNRAINVSGATGVADVVVSGCSFSASVDELIAPSVTAHAGTGVLRLVWTCNHHTGYRSLATQDRAFGFSASASAMFVSATGNVFRSLQSAAAYVGAGTGQPSIAKLSGVVHTWSFSGNTVADCGLMTSGNTMCLVLVHATNSFAGWTLSSGSIVGNSIGNANSHAGLVAAYQPIIRSLNVSNNSVCTAVPHNSLPMIGLYASPGGANGSLVVSGNSIVQESGFVGNFVILGDTGGGSQFTSVVFNNNSLCIPSAESVRMLQTNSGTSIISLYVHGNVAAILGDTVTSPVAHFNFPTPTNFNGNGNGTFPAATASYPDNVNINRP